VTRPLRRIVVVGAGLAGLRSAESLRRAGYDGELVLAGAEHDAPYDRPPLSKDVLLGTVEPDATTLRPRERLDELGIELLLGVAASELDLESRSLRVGGRRLPFDGLILATGASPRSLPGLEGMAGVHVLRTADDAAALRAALLEAKRAVVIGAGFIGAEVAASARTLGVDVTIVELEERPLARILGEDVGRAVAGLHGVHGTELRLGTTVARIEEAAAGLDVRLSDGARLQVDVVVVGVGVAPNTSWLAGSGLELENGIVCDAALNAGSPGVYAVGDVASWPNPLFGRRMRVEHWTNAIEQARHAAANLLDGTAEPFAGSNYCWSDQYGTRIQFAGVATGDVATIDGTLEDRSFLAWYRDGERLVGAVAMAAPEAFMRSKRLIEDRASWRDAQEQLHG
jgi:NADPH-dependent 2,4-dienoyl-CoA reductase/sulfur reductase-like enzyme